MKKNYLLFLSFFFLALSYSQTELKLGTGFDDYPGLGIEQVFNGYGLELSGSFRRKTTEIDWHGPAVYRVDKSFINLAFKIYFKEIDHGFYAGAYLRLRSRNSYVADPFNFTPERKAFVDTIGQAVGYATRSDKFSIGILAGYKWLIGKHFLFETNYGFGFAPYYKITSKQFYYPNTVRDYEGDDFTGTLERMSLYGHVMLGYRFGK